MKKNNNIIQFRELSEKAIKDVDYSKRKVMGYFSSFDTKDSHDDVIRPGAFSKSIKERGPNASGNRRIAHLFQHDMNEPIGKILELEEDSFGLRFVSEIINTQKGNDILVMYQEGVIREHSIGFNYIADKVDFVEDGEYWEIKEVKLFEGSSVTFGSNENTPYLGAMKSLSIEDQLKKLNKDFEGNLRILHNGRGSDELLQTAEYNIRLIQKSYNELLTTPKVKAVKNTLTEEPKKEESFFLSLLNNKQK